MSSAPDYNADYRAEPPREPDEPGLLGRTRYERYLIRRAIARARARKIARGVRPVSPVLALLRELEGR
jgi:hypothetical protein